MINEGGGRGSWQGWLAGGVVRLGRVVMQRTEREEERGEEEGEEEGKEIIKKGRGKGRVGVTG